jgi:hypothetical protein
MSAAQSTASLSQFGCSEQLVSRHLSHHNLLPKVTGASSYQFTLFLFMTGLFLLVAGCVDMQRI